jgi:hypothetical protein
MVVHHICCFFTNRFAMKLFTVASTVAVSIGPKQPPRTRQPKLRSELVTRRRRICTPDAEHRRPGLA